MIYNISDEPVYGFKRKVQVDSINIGISTNSVESVILTTSVKYYSSDEVTKINIIPRKIVNLVADNTTWVDSNGNMVSEGDPSAVMTEYEFFMAMMNVPVVISDIVQSKVAWADSLGRFN